MGDLQFNFDSERLIYEKLFHVRFILFSELLPEICWEEIAEDLFFFHISFRCLTWVADPGFTSSRPTHYLLDYSDLNYTTIRSTFQNDSTQHRPRNVNSAKAVSNGSFFPKGEASGDNSRTATTTTTIIIKNRKRLLLKKMFLTI